MSIGKRSLCVSRGLKEPSQQGIAVSSGVRGLLAEVQPCLPQCAATALTAASACTQGKQAHKSVSGSQCVVPLKSIAL